MLEILGIVGGLIALGGFIPYIRDIFLLRVKPQRATFFIWSVLGVIIFFSQLAEGASNSLWLPGLETFGVVLTFILSIKYGVGGFEKKDYLALLVAGVGLIAWYFTKEAVVALYLTIAIDTAGLILTLHKTYLDPKSETHLGWFMASLGSLFSLLSVGTFNLILLSYPFYVTLANASVIVAIEMGLRRRKYKYHI